MPRHLLPILIALVVIGPASTPCGAQQSGHLRAAGLRCEYLSDPLAIQESSPRLTWTVESPRRAERQSAYRILVASSPDALARDTGDLWDSGKVESGATAHIPYSGKPLTSRTRCFWKVMAWDRDGAPGPWSKTARWEVGLLSPDDWHAQWIDAGAASVPVTIERAEYYATDGSVRNDVTGEVTALVQRGEKVIASNAALGGDPAPNILKRLSIRYRCGDTALDTDVQENATAALANSRIPCLRRQFTTTKPIRHARLYATALGVYDLHLNGKRIGTDYLTPGWTDYRKRVHYQTYDVTGDLAQGRNALGAIVAPGWFCGRAGLFHAREFYGKTPALLAQLEITYQDGTTERVISDGSWRRHDGPILAADLMDGEIFDARASLDDWSSPTLDDSAWAPVVTRAESRTLEAQPDLPIRSLLELPARTVTEPKPGRWTFDLGQNMVGVARLRVSETRGTVITIRHAEMLNPDGTSYTTNIRGAAATDTYICRGGDPEEWQPRFTFHGFRYVEITGVSRKPDPGTVTGIVLGSDLPPAGEFSSSDTSLNQLQSNIVWGLRGNYLSIPTDCPQRDERMGWMGDAQVFAPTAAFNADIAAFMTKWTTDVADAQREDGAHADVAPVMNGLSYGTPAWADAGVIVPWTLYQFYGDTRILERHIDSMTRWVDWCRTNSTGLIRDKARGNDYGDWLSINADTPKDLMGTAYFAHSADIVARALGILGRDSEARRYQELSEDIRAAFVAKYVDSDARLTGNTQTGYLLALRFNLLPEGLRERALEHLISEIQSRGCHLSTGFVGVVNLLPVLSDAGRADLAYALLMQDTFPSWLFSVRHGATTIWERWDGWTPDRGPHPDWSMNSFNHYALGSCGQWLFSDIGGITPDPEHPGFGHFYIRPRTEGPLTGAAATYRSIRGPISTRWSLDGERLTLNVGIPANTTATVLLPARDGTEVLESSRSVEAGGVEGVRLLRREAGTTVLSVASGTYAFASHIPTSVARSGNPILPGWYADPEVAILQNRFWIYPTTSAGYDQQTYLDAFSSPDLARWTKHPRVLECADVGWARRALWAPSVIENAGRYFLFFSANDIQNDDQAGGIGIAVSESPAGPFKDYLGRPLIDKFHNGAQPIDQFVFRDRDGRHYLIYGGWRHCNIARLTPDFRGLEPFEDGTTFREITPENYVEGPFLFERAGKYYFMWSEGGWTGPDYSVAYAISDSPVGPFRRIGKILQQDPAIATGAGHHSVLKHAGSGDYYIVYHRRPGGDNDPNHRLVCIERMTFDAEARIQPVVITHEGVDAAPIVP